MVGLYIAFSMIMAGLGLGFIHWDSGGFGGAIVGLKLMAIAVILYAAFQMTRSLAPSGRHRGIVATAAVIAIWQSGESAQWLVIVFGAIAGYTMLAPSGPDDTSDPSAGKPRINARVGGWTWFGLVGLVLLSIGLTNGSDPSLALIGDVLQVGGLVFGGGHLLMPMLEPRVVDPGWLSPDAFAAGYALVQAMPGPLFTFVAYIGALQGGLGMAAALTIVVFIPSFLLIKFALSMESGPLGMFLTGRICQGLNGSVIGLLIAVAVEMLMTFASSLPIALIAVTITIVILWRRWMRYGPLC